MRLLLLSLLALPLCAGAQRADDNAVESSEDAFGKSVGNEDIGLYNPFDVRGFSAVDAGNVRLDGLYFDRQTNPSRLLVPSSTMRVGISVQGYVLPAPTGIVDYELLRAGDDWRVSSVAGYGPYDGYFTDLEFALPLVKDRFGIAGGFTLYEDAFESGSDENGYALAIAPRWRPTESIEIIPFYSRLTQEDSEAMPLTFVSGPHLPPRVNRDYFYGQDWADNEGVGENSGVVANFKLPREWAINLGIFRSEFDATASFADLYLNTNADGFGERLLIADRNQNFASTSGEFRVSRRVVRGDSDHTFYYSLRARDQQRRYGGSDIIDYGIARIGERVRFPEPEFQFGEQTRDEVEQSTHALAYRGRLSRLAEVTLGVQETRYEKRVTEPDALAPQLGKDDPWLYSAGIALTQNDQLAWYASYSTGLEEGGVAPDNATNKNAAPPAIRTKQWDLGLRYAFTPSLKAVAGVFNIEKPYYSLDERSVYRELGQEVHRGFEFSIAGQLVEGLNVVIGTILQEPRVKGEEVDNGRIGKIPVAQTERVTIASADYRLPWLSSVSIDTLIQSNASRMASSDNRLSIPARSVMDLGARYRFKIGRAPATLRVYVGNVFDTFGWRTNSSQVFTVNGPRRYSISIAADFPGS